MATYYFIHSIILAALIIVGAYLTIRALRDTDDYIEEMEDLVDTLYEWQRSDYKLIGQLSNKFSMLESEIASSIKRNVKLSANVSKMKDDIAAMQCTVNALESEAAWEKHYKEWARDNDVNQ